MKYSEVVVLWLFSFVVLYSSVLIVVFGEWIKKIWYKKQNSKKLVDEFNDFITTQHTSFMNTINDNNLVFEPELISDNPNLVILKNKQNDLVELFGLLYERENYVYDAWQSGKYKVVEELLENVPLIVTQYFEDMSFYKVVKTIDIKKYREYLEQEMTEYKQYLEAVKNSDPQSI